MSCVVAAASELIAPECVLIVAATIAATISPTSPCGMCSTMNVGKIWSGAGNVRPSIERPEPERRSSRKSDELQEHDEAAADDRALRVLERPRRQQPLHDELVGAVRRHRRGRRRR